VNVCESVDWTEEGQLAGNAVNNRFVTAYTGTIISLHYQLIQMDAISSIVFSRPEQTHY